MALLSYALTTEARVKTFLGVSVSSYDSLFTSLINAATEFIEKYCDRRFKQTAYSNEVYDGNNTSQLLLKQYPVISSATVTVERRGSIENRNVWDTISSIDYFVKYTTGIIVRTDALFEAYPQHYRVSYTAGYDLDVTVAAKTLEAAGAADLEYACWKLVGMAFKNRNTNPNVSSESLGDYSISYRKYVLADSEIQEILDKYVRPYGFS